MNGPAAMVSNSFVNVTDPRLERGHNHDLLEMIFITLTATICGANSWVDVERFAKAKIRWFRRYIELENGVPSHDTLGRVFSRLDAGEFLAAMHHWVDLFAGSLRGKGVAIDGKVLRGSFDRAASQSGPSGNFVGSVEFSAKENYRARQRAISAYLRTQHTLVGERCHP